MFDRSTNNEVTSCIDHRQVCGVCDLSMYDTSKLQCNYVNPDTLIQCPSLSCRTGWFQSYLTRTVIHACHDHICECFWCDKKFPATNRRTIKFRNGLRIVNCTNCYKPIAASIHWFLMCLKRMTLSSTMPRDVIGMIISHTISDVEVEKKTKKK